MLHCFISLLHYYWSPIDTSPWLKGSPLIITITITITIAISDASLLHMIMADGPHPPVEERTIGVNDLCSTSTTLFSYALLYSFSWRL